MPLDNRINSKKATEFRIWATKILKEYMIKLLMIIVIGFKVNNERTVQFRKWVNGIVKEYIIKGFAMDDERLKNGGSIITEKYFVFLFLFPPII